MTLYNNHSVYIALITRFRFKGRMPEGPELRLSARFINEVCEGKTFKGPIVKSEVNKNPVIGYFNDAELFKLKAISRGKELKLLLNEVFRLITLCL